MQNFNFLKYNPNLIKYYLYLVTFFYESQYLFTVSMNFDDNELDIFLKLF